MELQQYGLIGQSLQHTFSPQYFSEKFERENIKNASYLPFPLASIADFPSLLARVPGIRGLNVTVPYKVAVIPYLDHLDHTASGVGAVNTISIRQDGFKAGFNTDVFGFTASLSGWIPDVQSRRMPAIVLGNGGASKAVIYGLTLLGVPCVRVSRTPGTADLGYADVGPWLAAHPSALLIHTTPVGMYPDMEACLPLPWEHIGKEHFVYDLIYNPSETLLLQRARRQGAAVKNGLEMLHLQAERSWQIWQQA